ncbi:MAG: CHAT domain-containing protein [Tissierellales bacterium]|nr:CHAT domain-containing protein [Tissierellales bacterium]
MDIEKSQNTPDVRAAIEKQTDRILELVKQDPNRAYSLAIDNLNHAQETKDDGIVFNCASILGYVATQTLPVPNLHAAIKAFQLASEKALILEDLSTYAGTEFNLGRAYSKLTTGNLKENFGNAIGHYKKALTIYNAMEFPDEYAETQIALGNIYANLPIEPQEENFKNVISCYDNALKVHTIEKYPYQYASLQTYLANVYGTSSIGNREDNLKKAITHLKNSLLVCTIEEYPHEYAITQGNLGDMYYGLSTGNQEENLKSAITAYENALRVYSVKNFPEEYARMQYNLGTAYSNISGGEQRENLNRSINAYKNALHVYTKQEYPQDYIKVQINLGLAYQNLTVEKQDDNLIKAITCYEEVLSFVAVESSPYEYAAAHYNLGNVYSNLLDGDIKDNLRLAIASYENALPVFMKMRLLQQYHTTEWCLNNARRKLVWLDSPNVKSRSAQSIKEAFELIQIILNQVHSLGDIFKFAAHHLQKCDDSFFALLQAIIQDEKGKESENNAPFLEYIEQALQELQEYEKALSEDIPLTKLTDDIEKRKRLISGEGGIILELLNFNPNIAYSHASANLQQALRLGNCELIYPCAFTLGQAAVQYRPYSKWKEAIEAFHIASENSLIINNNSAYAMIQHKLGDAYAQLPTENRNENLHKSLVAYENSLKFYTETKYPREYASIQRSLGHIYIDLIEVNRNNNLNKALTFYENALRIFTENELYNDRAMTLYSIARVCIELSYQNERAYYLNKAFACSEDALEAISATEFPDEYVTILNGLGIIYTALPTGNREENFAHAIKCYKRALEIISKTDFPRSYAMTCQNLGNAYADLLIGDQGENLHRAITYYENALSVYTKTEFPRKYIATQNNLGSAYRKLPIGNNKENIHSSIDCFENALNICDESTTPYDYAFTQYNLANTYSKLSTEEGYYQSIAAYQKALIVFTEVDYPYEYAQSQNNLGLTYRDLDLLIGESDKHLGSIITCYENALRVFTENGFPRDYAMTQVNLGIAYIDLKRGDIKDNLEKAIVCFENALRIYTELIFPNERVNTLSNIAFAYTKSPLENWQAAYNYCAEAIQVLEKHIRIVSTIETRHVLAERYGVNLYPLIVTLCTIHLNKIDEAIGYAERAKSRTLVEMLHTLQLNPSKDIPIGIREAFLESRQKVIELRYFRQIKEQEVSNNFKGRYDAEEQVTIRNHQNDHILSNTEIWQHVDEAEKTYQNALQQIREIDPEFASTEQLLPLSIEEIQDLIPPKTVFVECFANYDGLYLYILDNQTSIREMSFTLKDLGISKLLNTIAFKQWLVPYYDFLQERTQKSHQEWFETLENIPRFLAEQFWYAENEQGKSLAQLIEQSNSERIVFLPHTGLHLLPLHLIPLKSGGKLIDEYEISYAPSATLLQFALQRERNDLSHLFAVANPTCDPKLKFTLGEVYGISKHFNQHQILWHEQAIKETIYEQAEEANILHFSCHGSFRPGKPLESCLLLADNDHKTNKDLTLRDIFANLKLRNAAAVVLSACETGMVELERGDEYIGLSSGFLYAGAPTVLSSLWAVDDLSTSLLMNRLYENFIPKKMGKAAALRDAQLWVRDLTYQELVGYLEQASLGERIDYEILRGFQRTARRYPAQKPFEHPFYWGAFTCNGSWK